MVEAYVQYVVFVDDDDDELMRWGRKMCEDEDGGNDGFGFVAASAADFRR